jgi:hypothetical protein
MQGQWLVEPRKRRKRNSHLWHRRKVLVSNSHRRMVSRQWHKHKVKIHW